MTSLHTHSPLPAFFPKLDHPAPHQKISSWAEADIIQDANVNLLILERVPLEVPATIRELLASSRSHAQVALDKRQNLDLIPALLDEDLDLRSPDSHLFYNDLRLMAGAFFRLTGAKSVGVRLERVEDNSCRLFHVDHLRMRLITTYVGPGTQWLKNEDVNRGGLGQGDDSLVLREGAVIQNANCGDICLLKGERGNMSRGIVHRSPPIEESGEMRIVLRMDVLD